MRTSVVTRGNRLSPRVVAFSCLALLAIIFGGGDVAIAVSGSGDYTDDFRLEECTFLNRGRTPFFVLEPGYQLILKGTEGKDQVELTITVLGDEEVVKFHDGVKTRSVKTRVVEENETKNGIPAEVSRNRFAICTETNSVVYFGEDVTIYNEDGTTSSDGSWRAGVGGAKPGIMMPGTFLLGSRYFQEIAPGVAMDRGENTAMNLDVTVITVDNKSRTFSRCVEVTETTPLEPGKQSIKVYCPGVGLVRDNTLTLWDWSERR